YHTELSRDGPGLLLRDIASGKDEQVEAVVNVIAHLDADVLVLGDIDFDYNAVALSALARRLDSYPFQFAKLPNRGRQSGYDLDGDGLIGGASDAWGYGEFTGQGGLAILSKHPLGEVVDYSAELWTGLERALALPETSPEQPLSTTAHWEVPVLLPDGQRVTLMSWHATAPVFDGPKDRNGRRNHDEAAFWLERLNTLPPPYPILAGFANLDVFDGDGRPEALNALLAHDAIIDPRPISEGGALAGTADSAHRGPAALDTVAWPQDGPGNLRVDYLLPSSKLEVTGAGVFWPTPDQFLGKEVVQASRHRMVWVDINVPDR
ncbi:unnamed protein product, partial [Ectocarpus sp. 12 AP-2014]